MITLDLSILNQKGTPMFFSDLTANRPAAGIVGRIFIAIDSPFGIFRDTGTGWDQVSSAGGGTTIYTGNGTLTGNRTVSSGGFSLIFNPQTTFLSSLIPSTSSSSYSVLGSNTLTYAAGFSSLNIGNVYSANGAINSQVFSGSATFAQANLVSAMVSVNSVDFSTPGSTITMTQSTGIRAMTGHQSQFQYQGTFNGTITHAAVSQNLGFYRPPSATGTLTITNAYGHLINALDDYGAGFTFTNRFGIYQAGASDINYFAARVGIGITAPTESLHVIGAGLFNSGAANFPLQGVSSSSLSLVRLTNSSGSVSFGRDGTFASIEVNATGRLFISSIGNVLVGASTDNGNRFQVYGGSSFSGYLTASGNISVNNRIELANDGANGVIQMITQTNSLNFRKYVKVLGDDGGVGNNNASAAFQIDGTNRGFLPPRLTTAQINAIVSPAEGLQIFNTTISHMCFYQGGAWVRISSSPM